MDLDNIKDIWSQENPDTTPEISLENQKELHLPLEKLRKNMRKEFWSTIVLFVFIILFLTFVDFHFFKFKIYVITLVASMMLITAFYYYKFFLLYKNLTSVDFNLLENLKDLKFQFKLNEQYYLGYYIAFVPFTVAEVILIFEFIPGWKNLTGFSFILYLSIFCLLMLGALYVVGKWWFQKFYGKYFSQILNLIDDLK
ncbi:hypothetical protein SAMN05421847_0281 [Halpernia humi]|uniref:Uncharacterized protein n=1 Tax=Halpernia humi TaxID=493375 RepID=A0A1H5SVR1_9FLAO|nr:hypothetical protein [Halpernia humi]SEF54595.1 hypothetical protein SAMN05421847_0281 [Halpernia humi]